MIGPGLLPQRAEESDMAAEHTHNKTMKRRVAILISGRGSNMTALVNAAKSANYPAEIALVISNQPNATGLEFAQKAGLSTSVVSHADYEDRGAFENALNEELKTQDIDYICLAGFMRLLTAEFVNRWKDRILNIHPSLLPAFKGLDTHERALESGVRFSGCTVHFVRAEMDDGPIINQAVVPILSDDTPETLAARILAQEHQLYPEALRLVASGQARVTDRIVKIGDTRDPASPIINPPIEDDD